MKYLAIAALVIFMASGARADDRMAWFREARFGMFIHWGIYSVPAGEWEGKTNYAEWFQLQTRMPNAQYEKFAAQFNPVKFDAQAWAKIAKDAGMKYVVITAKHHDGFSMYDSKLTEYDIVDATPYKKDPMKDLADAVRGQGMTFCFYYSIPDWHSRDFPAKYSQRATTTRPGFHGDPHDDADLERYVTYMKGQIRELLTNYGPIGILWFDGGGSFMKDDPLRAKLIHAQEIIDLIHELQPNCLVNNRLGLPADYGTPEQKIPESGLATPWETCMTLNKHWGYNKADHDFKSPKQLIQNLADIAGKGGNYLLNVGPTAEGEIPPESVEILGEVGKWMKANGESIYGAGPSKLANLPKALRATSKDKTTYVHVLEWPSDEKIAVSPVSTTPRRAYLLADAQKKPLTVEVAGDVATIALPSTAPDPSDSVIVLECE